MDNEESMVEKEVCYVRPMQDSWYADMHYFLTYGNVPMHLDPKQRRDIRLKAYPYLLIKSIMFRINYDGVLLRCLEKDEADKVLNELHDGVIGGNFGGDTIIDHKVL